MIFQNKFFIVVILLLLLVSPFHFLYGQVTALTTWTNVYNNTANPSVAVTIPTGSNLHRILLVGVASSRTTVGSRTATVTYGGQTLTLLSGDMATTTVRQHTAIYYLNEAGIDAATSTTLGITFGGGTTEVNTVFAGVYDYVNQTTPFSDKRNYNGGTTTGTTLTFTPGLTINENDLAVKVLSAMRAGSTTTRTISNIGTNWTTNVNVTYTAAGDAVRNASATRSLNTSATSTADVATVTMSGSVLRSMTGATLNSLPKKFRSVATGDWNSLVTWEQSMNDGNTWVAATTIPADTNDIVTIQSTDTVTLTANATASSLTIDGVLDQSTFTLTGTTGLLVSASGKLRIGGAGNAPTGFTTNTFDAGSTVEYYSAGNQTAGVFNYHHVNLLGSGIKTLTSTTINGKLSLEGTVTVSGTPTYGAASTLQYKGSALQTTGDEFPATWTGTGGVLIENASGVTLAASKTISGSSLTIGGIVSNSILNDGGFQLIASGTSVLNLTSGLLKLTYTHATNAIFPAFTTNNIADGTTVEYGAAGTQTIKGTTYSNLTLSGAGANSKIADADITVNGVLTLPADNASSTQGSLHMSTFTLHMGVNATTVGSGDVTGIIKRTHTFAGNINYTLGNEETHITFLNTGVKPQWISCKITIGAAPTWKTGAVQRTYSFASDGTGTDEVDINLAYRDAELNGNTETKLVFYDYHTSVSVLHEHGKSNHDAVVNWVSMAGYTVNYIMPVTLDSKIWALADNTAIKNTWIGVNTVWENNANWTSGHYPGDTGYLTDDVLIPAGKSNYPVLASNVEMKSFEMEAGAALSANSFNITLNGYLLTWENAGTFNPGTGTVIFSHNTISHVVSVNGETDFNHISVTGATYLQPGEGAVLHMNGNFSASLDAKLDFVATSNLIDYTGTASRTIINPVGPGTDLGYHDVKFTNTAGSITFPARIDIAGDFTNNGTIDTSTGTVYFDGTMHGHDQHINGTTSTTFNHVIVNNNHNFYVVVNQDVVINGTLEIAVTSMLNMQTYVLSGTLTSTSGTTGKLLTANTGSTPIPTGKTWNFVVEYNASGNQTISAGNYTNLTLSNSGTKAAGGNLSNSTLLTVNSGVILDMVTYSLSGSGLTTAGTGALKTQNTSSTPIPSGRTWSFNVDYNAGSNQTVQNAVYNNLLLSGSGTKTFAGNATVNGVINVATGVIADLVTYVLEGASLVPAGTGVLKTQNISSTPLPANKTWTFGVHYNANGNQTITGGTYSNLSLLAGGIKSTNVNLVANGVLAVEAGVELDLLTYTLTGSYTTSGTGILHTQNTSSTPIPSGKTWSFLIDLNGVSQQYLSAGTYANVNINNAAGVHLVNGNTADISGTLTISSGKVLYINPGAVMVSQNVLNNNGVSGLIIQSAEGMPNGSFQFANNISNPVAATVEMYSKAYAANLDTLNGVYSNHQWQYIGVPVSDFAKSNPLLSGTYIRQFTESSSLGWGIANSVLEGFRGYSITQPVGKKITWQGNLFNQDKTINLSFTSGIAFEGANFVANSFTSAVEIAQITFGSGVNESVSLFNTGKVAHDSVVVNMIEDFTPGQYITIPKNNAGNGGLPETISSMQGFFVESNDATNNQITIPYAATTSNVSPMRAPNLQSSNDFILVMSVVGERYADKIWLFGNPACSNQFDNGWDGKKMFGLPAAPQLYVKSDQNVLQVQTTNTIDQTRIGINKGEDSVYTFILKVENKEVCFPDGMYLIDTRTDESIEVFDNITEYSFTLSEGEDASERFVLSKTPNLNTDITTSTQNNQVKITGVEDKINIQNKSDHDLQIFVSDLTGKVVMQSFVSAQTDVRLVSALPTGLYTVSARGNQFNQNQLIRLIAL